MDASRIEDSFPLAPIQEGMLFDSLYSPGSSVNVLIFMLELGEVLDEPLLLRAWRRVTDRHPALRTCFRWQGLERPCQEVHRGVDQPVRQEDWSPFPEEEQERRWLALQARERGTGFDMATPPLTRLTIVRLGPGRSRLLWTYHHAVLDAIGRSRVLAQVFAAYRALQRGEEDGCKPSPTLRAYVEWLRKQDLSASEGYWRERLAGFEAPTRLGIDRGEDEAGGRGESRIETCPIQDRSLSESDTAALREWTRARGLSVNIALQGAWAVLLSRYSGERRVLFGVVRSGRWSSIEGADDLVGVLLNTLPTAIDVDPDAEVVAWLARLKADWSALRPHDHTPLGCIREWSGIEGRGPLFESVVCYDVLDATAGMRALVGVPDHCRAEGFSQPSVPVSLNAYDGRRLLLRVSYHSLRVGHDAITRLLGHLETLLVALAAGTARRVSDLPILAEAERRRILLDWNDTRADVPDRRVHELFEGQAARTPDAVAVQFAERRVTYAALARQASRVAHHLRARGVGRGDLVGLCVERSAEMVAGLLGILAAGAAYVPLDPSHPGERRAFVLEDAGVRLLLDDAALAEALEGGPTTEPQRSGDGPGDLAYVIYTSGSTGRPKGVEVTHGAVVNFLTSMRREPGLGPEDRLLAVTTVSFDIAGLELLLPLSVGACVHIASRAQASDGAALGRLLAESGATVLQATPVTWRLLLASGWAGEPRLKALCGGEALPRDLAEALLGRVGELWNLYGPTETTIWSTLERIRSTEGPISIGRPIANTRVYILDAALSPVPPGVAGELCIGGAGLARGYHARPELTRERFIRDPHSDDPAARLFRTGDLARALADGRIEHLGRLDFQVKIRGFRIELGEIEATLLRHPSVREVVAVVREDVPGDKRLVAYVARRSGSDAPGVEALRAHLASQIPEYMIPAAIVLLDALPLTTSGKVDRRALPAPSAERSMSEPPEAPTDEVERRLALVWQECFGGRAVGGRDDFFALGGHSLLAVALIARIRSAFGVDVPLISLFERPTVRAFADLLRAGAKLPSKTLIPLQPAGDRAPLYLVHSVGGEVLSYVELARSLGDDRPVYGVQARGSNDGESPRTRIDEMIDAYVEEILRVQPDGPYHLGGYSMGGCLAVEMARRLIAMGREVGIVAVIDQSVPGRRPAFGCSFVCRALENLPAWTLDLIRRGPSYFWSNVRRRLGLFRKLSDQGALRAHDLMDVDHFGDRMRRVVEAHVAAFRGRRTDAYPGRLCVFQARIQPLISTHEPALGWRGVARDGVALAFIPGDHETIMRPPHMRTLARRIRMALSAYEGRRESRSTPRAS